MKKSYQVTLTKRHFMKFLFLFFLSFSISLFAQEEKKTFNLKDGSTLVGEVIAQSDSTFKIKTTFGEMQINKADIIEKPIFTSTTVVPNNDERLQIRFRNDLEFDFTIGHTAYAQYHGFALGVIFENPLTLLINGGSYFVASNLAKSSKDISRIAVENSIAGHVNGIGQGWLAGTILTIDSDFENPEKVFFGASVLGGLSHAYYSYKFSTQNYLPEHQSYFNHLAERYAPAWLFGSIFILPDEGIKNVFEFIDNNTKVSLSILLASSLSSHYWGEKLIGNRNMSLGDMMMANEFHFASLGSGIALLNVIEPDDVQLVAGIMLASSALGWYYGLLQNEGNNFTYEDGRFTSRMVYAGGLAGFGLAAAMQVDEFKVFMLFTSAGMWGGYFYGRNNAIQEKNHSSNWDLKISPENYFLSNAISKNVNLLKPINLPIINFKLNLN